MMRYQPGTKQRKSQGVVNLSPIRLADFAGIAQGKPMSQQSNEFDRSLALSVRPVNGENADEEP